MLKNYNTDQKNIIPVGTIPSGVKSGDSDAELMIVEPIIKHPEMDGFVRAVDPDTGWMGWVKYLAPEPKPDPVVPPTQDAVDLDEYDKLLNEYNDKKSLVDSGVFTETELDLETLRDTLRLKFKEEYVKNV